MLLNILLLKLNLVLTNHNVQHIPHCDGSVTTSGVNYKGREVLGSGGGSVEDVTGCCAGDQGVVRA